MRVAGGTAEERHRPLPAPHGRRLVAFAVDSVADASWAASDAAFSLFPKKGKKKARCGCSAPPVPTSGTSVAARRTRHASEQAAPRHVGARGPRMAYSAPRYPEDTRPAAPTARARAQQPQGATPNHPGQRAARHVGFLCSPACAPSHWRAALHCSLPASGDAAAAAGRTAGLGVRGARGARLRVGARAEASSSSASLLRALGCARARLLGWAGGVRGRSRSGLRKKGPGRGHVPFVTSPLLPPRAWR